MFKLTRAQAENILDLNWCAAVDEQSFDSEYSGHGPESRELFLLLLNGGTRLTDEQAQHLLVDMDFIVSRAEDRYDESWERDSQLAALSVRTSMRKLRSKLKGVC